MGASIVPRKLTVWLRKLLSADGSLLGRNGSSRCPSVSLPFGTGSFSWPMEASGVTMGASIVPRKLTVWLRKLLSADGSLPGHKGSSRCPSVSLPSGTVSFSRPIEAYRLTMEASVVPRQLTVRHRKLLSADGSLPSHKVSFHSQAVSFRPALEAYRGPPEASSARLQASFRRRKLTESRCQLILRQRRIHCGAASFRRPKRPYLP